MVKVRNARVRPLGAPGNFAWSLVIPALATLITRRLSSAEELEKGSRLAPGSYNAQAATSAIADRPRGERRRYRWTPGNCFGIVVVRSA